MAILLIFLCHLTIIQGSESHKAIFFYVYITVTPPRVWWGSIYYIHSPSCMWWSIAEMRISFSNTCSLSLWHTTAAFAHRPGTSILGLFFVHLGLSIMPICCLPEGCMSCHHCAYPSPSSCILTCMAILLLYAVSLLYASAGVVYATDFVIFKSEQC